MPGQATQSHTYETITGVLVAKGFLQPIPVMPMMDDWAKKKFELPYLIPTPVWRHLNENKEWLLQRAIEMNSDHQARMRVLTPINL